MTGLLRALTLVVGLVLTGLSLVTLARLAVKSATYGAETGDLVPAVLSAMWLAVVVDLLT